MGVGAERRGLWVQGSQSRQLGVSQGPVSIRETRPGERSPAVRGRPARPPAFSFHPLLGETGSIVGLGAKRR